MPFRSLLLVLALVIAPPALAGAALAQVPANVAVGDTIWEVRLADGSVLYGRVAAVDAERLTIVSDAGVRVELERAQVRAMAPARGSVRNGALWPDDPNTTRLFFGPTGRTMRAGEGYVAAYELFLPFVSYSLTDWFTIAGGTPIVPGVIGELFYVAPKVALYQRPDLAVSGGVLAFFSAWEDVESAGIVYGVGTWGPADRSVTVGAGWPFASGDLASRPVFMAGGELRTSRRVKLVTENYAVTIEESTGPSSSRTELSGLLSGGVRFIGDRLSADLGLGYGYEGTDGFCCIPLVNFVYHLGGGS